MKIHKSPHHSLSLRPFAWQGRQYLMLCVGLYSVFGPDGRAELRSEQQLWQETPPIFAALGQPPILDAGLPKPGAEVLLAGFCRAPGQSRVSAQEVLFGVGGLERRILVFGERGRLPGGGFTESEPFAEMPLVWQRAFGGPAHAVNPQGRGMEPDAAGVLLAPNLEDPGHRLLLPQDSPRPVCPLPLPPDAPERRSLSGTYDQEWLETRWPALPDDCAPEFFYSAQASQRLGTADGSPRYFEGGEEVIMQGLRHDGPVRGKLPRPRLRAFVLTCQHFCPFAESGSDASLGETPSGNSANTAPPLPYSKNLDAPGIFQEVELRCDTVWLFPDLPGAVQLYRGLLPVEDDEMDDILRVLVADEKPQDEPRSLEFYREELRRQARPALSLDLAPLVEAQAQIRKAVKQGRDVPKLLARIKADMLGQRPVMPLNVADMEQAARSTIAVGRSTLDGLERQVLGLREQFSHVMSFDVSIFSNMRAMLDNQEQQLEKTLRRSRNALQGVERRASKALSHMHSQMKESGLAARLTPEQRQDMARLESFANGEAFTSPTPLNPWHDRAFALQVAARRALRRNPAMQAELARCGLTSETQEENWLGCATAPLEDRPENWGLPPGPALHLPAGLYLPRFAGKEQVGLLVYPLGDDGRLVTTGEPTAASASPHAPAGPLSLPPSYPDGAILVVQDALTALLAEQETGDFCHVLAARSPQELLQADPPVQGIPPSEAEPALPLRLLLPAGAGGPELLAAWQAVFPAAEGISLPEGCSHALALTEQGHGLRRLVLDSLPPELAAKHDFDIPLPTGDGPPQPFKLNLPLPEREELQTRIDTLIRELRASFPDPQTQLAQQQAAALARINTSLTQATLPSHMRELFQRKLQDATDHAAPPTPSISEMLQEAQGKLDALGQRALAGLPPDGGQTARRLEHAQRRLHRLDRILAPLEELRAAGLAKLEALKQGVLPAEVQEALDKNGVTPDALRPLSREDVVRIMAEDRNLERRNLQGLDLSGLDLRGARLSHALCSKTSFAGAQLDGAELEFTLAPEADLAGASLRGARLKQAVLQDAVLRGTNWADADISLCIFRQCDNTDSRFDGATLSLCTFAGARLDGASFAGASLSLCHFGQIRAGAMRFGQARAFKCLFHDVDLNGADFSQADLTECRFQAVTGAGLGFVGACLHKSSADMETDLRGANFAQADLREASFRMCRLPQSDFWQARLEGALFQHCDLRGARLDGLHGTGCRFVKCDLQQADISHSQLMEGALRKCRLNGADLRGANLYSADLDRWLIDGESRFDGCNFSRTRLEGKEDALRHAANRSS